MPPGEPLTPPRRLERSPIRPRLFITLLAGLRRHGYPPTLAFETRPLPIPLLDGLLMNRVRGVESFPRTPPPPQPTRERGETPILTRLTEMMSGCFPLPPSCLQRAAESSRPFIPRHLCNNGSIPRR